MNNHTFLRGRLFCLMLLLVAAGTPVAAQWSTSSTVNNAVATGTSTQAAAKTASDGSGGIILTWHDNRSGNFDIYAQRINAYGVVQWTANGVAISTAANNQMNPIIIADGSGGAIIAWEDEVSVVGSPDIYAQRIDASGAVQWTANGVVVSNATNVQRYPAIALVSTGDVVIAWEDKRGAANYDIYAQRVNPSGVVQWTANGVVVSTALDDQSKPVIANCFSGGIIISWMDNVNGGTTGLDIYVQRLNTSGVALMTANGVAICAATSGQYNPKMIYGGNSDALITWEDYRSATNMDVYAQRVTSTGAQWTANGVAISTAAGEQSSLTIAPSGFQGAIIAWQDKRGGSKFDIYAQHVNASGTVQWTADGVVITTATDDQYEPAITFDQVEGSWVVAWSDYRNGLGAPDIYAQRVNFNGVAQWTANGAPVGTATGSQFTPVILYDNVSTLTRTGYIVAWNDNRSGNFDVYAQRVNVNGVLCGNPANPASITGSATILAGTSNAYSVATVVGADSYTWTLPANWTGTSATNAINATPDATGGTISVTGTNVCGNSLTPATLAITVNKQNQTITFGALSSKAFGDAAFNLTATASSSLAVNYTSSNTAVATVSGSAVTIVSAGTTTITAKQAGNTIFNAAADVPQLLTVNKGNQVITFSIPVPKVLGDAPLTMTASSTSGLPITYSSTDPAIASVSGSVLTLVTYGSVTINANQPGNANYNAAAQVGQTICVSPAKPTVTASESNTEAPKLTSNASTGNQWFLNGVAIPSATNALLTVASEGIYKVQVTRSTCTSAFSDDFVFVITGDLSFGSGPTEVSVFPNPTSDRLTVTLPGTAERKLVSIYQANGSAADSKETFGRELQFDVREYSQGIYLVRILSDKSTQVVRFIKK